MLGIYPEIIEEFIRNKYASKYSIAIARAASRDDDEFHSRMNKYLDYFNDYLGKIVQVRHDVPERHPHQMRNYIRHLLESAGVTSEFLVEGVSENDLLDLIAEVGKRSPREIVRKINWLIVKWRITKNEKNDDEEFDLLAGLINETFLDRESKGGHAYAQFLHSLEWLTGEDGSPTYGQSLADALAKKQNVADHWEKIETLKKELNAESSPTMNSLIRILDKDEHLCNVLNSGPGRRWLSNKKYREEMRDTYKEKEYREDTLETSDETKKEPSLPHELYIQKTVDMDHILPELKWIEVPTGEFQMGSDNGFEHERPVHLVKLDSFIISATQVTQKQYVEIMGVNPSFFKEAEKRDSSDDLPIEYVNWNDAMVFCEQLTKLTKGKGRIMLPTEAQWEYACRADTNTPFSTGENLTTEQANYNGNYPYKNNPKGRYLERTTSVGSYPSNPWGLYDMHGNVWKWCLDWYDEKYYDKCKKQEIVENPAGPKTGSFRVLRGGSWSINARNCRSMCRYSMNPASRYDFVGFRLVFVS